MGGEKECFCLMPHHARGMTEGHGERRVRRRFGGGARLRETTQRAGPGMRGRRASLVARSTLLTDTMADDAGTKRIGNGLASRPTGGNRRQHLHHQREQDYG